MTKEFYINNRKRYFDKIEDNSMTIILSGFNQIKTNDEDYDFEVDKCFYYLTGINQSEVYLVLIKENNKVKELLFIEENDPVKVKWVGAKLYKDEASNLSGVMDVKYNSELVKFLDENIKKYDKVYLNLEKIGNHRVYKNNYVSSKLIKKYSLINVIDCYPIIVELRSVKTKEELEKIQESINVTKIGIEELMKKSKPGLYEYQLESYFDFVIKNNGQKDVSFKTIAAGGVNAATLHYVANNTKLNDNELVLFDLGCRTDFYISDISRTFPVNGKFTPRQKEVYQSVLNVNKKCIEFLKEGITLKDYNDYAKKLLTEECKKLGLIDKDEDLVKYYFHSIGHSIGLDTHDPCKYNPYLTEGMVITCEPGLYMPEEKIGVRIEDDILITKNGSINLSKDIIKEVEDIENFMKNK